MRNNIRTKDRFTENGWFKEEYLWELRQQIVLNSIYVTDYRNSFGIDEKKVCYFFDGYISFLTEMEKEKYGKELDNISDFFDEFDTEENLKSWYGCFCDDCPLPPHIVNVDIHCDFARSIQVIADDEDEAEEIVQEMMEKGEIPQSSFEATGDWELDTTYQPEN